MGSYLGFECWLARYRRHALCNELTRRTNMRNFKLYMAALLVVGFASFAWADGYDLAYKNSSEFPTTTTAPASSDKKLIFIAADNKWELYGATVEKLTG